MMLTAGRHGGDGGSLGLSEGQLSEGRLTVTGERARAKERDSS